MTASTCWRKSNKLEDVPDNIYAACCKCKEMSVSACSNSWRHVCVVAHTCTCTHCQVCRIISETLVLLMSSQTPRWNQRNSDTRRGGGSLYLSVRPTDREGQWPEGLGGFSTTSDLQLFPHARPGISTYSTSAFAQAVPFYFPFSFRHKTLMSGTFSSSGNQVCVWTKKAVKMKGETEKGEFVGERWWRGKLQGSK